MSQDTMDAYDDGFRAGWEEARKLVRDLAEKQLANAEVSKHFNTQPLVPGGSTCVCGHLVADHGCCYECAREGEVCGGGVFNSPNIYPPKGEMGK